MMSQRAVKNAYSWWWASHIRTKQSKWIEQSLQDMEENVQNMLKLIEDDGDSFAKRAEMYYKRRPELITSVEEAFRAFRALADRYDLLSREMQNANNTIATVFPEQVKFVMEEDDESVATKIASDHQIPESNHTGNILDFSEAPIKELNGMQRSSTQLQVNDLSETGEAVQESCLTMDEAVKEIEKLQKDIQSLHAVREFVRSSYESGLSKYQEIENQMMGMQQKVRKLRDEFNVNIVIEDDEAQTLMSEAATKSCQEMLPQLQEKEERSANEAKVECLKIESVHEQTKSPGHENLHQYDQANEEKANKSDLTVNVDFKSQNLAEKVAEIRQEMNNVEMPPDKVHEDMDVMSMESLRGSEMGEPMDKLVNKVISLETAASYQTALINTLTTEADDLHIHIEKLEKEKVTLINGTHILTTRLKKMEENLRAVQDINQNIENQNRILQENLTDARGIIDHCSHGIDSLKPEETSSVQDQVDVQSPGGSEKAFPASKTEDMEDVKEVVVTVEDFKASSPGEGSNKNSQEKTLPFPSDIPNGQVLVDNSGDFITAQTEHYVEIKELNWQQMLLSGMEDREKILLKEYTVILRNYKDIKKTLLDVEKRGGHSQLIQQIIEQKDVILKKDEEIQCLRQKLNLERGIGDLELNENPLVNNEDDIKLVFVDRTPLISAVEEKLRMDIDAVLDENLDFWLRFSSAFQKIQKFKTDVQDLKDEILRCLEKKLQVGSVTSEQKSEVQPIYKHLRELQAELTVWFERSQSLKDEQKRRFSSLCCIQEEITKALNEGVEEEEIKFSSHQAAKFQGEILDMKHENNKVIEELQAGLDHVSTLQVEVARSLGKLNDEFGISSDQSQPKHDTSRSRTPLRAFIFGARPKKHKHSILSCVHPNGKSSIP